MNLHCCPENTISQNLSFRRNMAKLVRLEGETRRFICLSSHSLVILFYQTGALIICVRFLGLISINNFRGAGLRGFTDVSAELFATLPIYSQQSKSAPFCNAPFEFEVYVNFKKGLSLFSRWFLPSF